MSKSGHHIEVRAAEEAVRVSIGGRVVAETTRALALSEGRLPLRWYILRSDILAELEPSDHRTTCPFKGEATHFDVAGEQAVAWSYEDPIDAVRSIKDRVAFYDERVDVQID